MVLLASSAHSAANILVNLNLNRVLRKKGSYMEKEIRNKFAQNVEEN